MILYKYVPFAKGRQVLESGRVRFSDARSFNDPFDTPTYPGEDIANPLQAMLAGLQLQLKQSIWASNTGILSLTRTPSNPLMWAHYPDAKFFICKLNQDALSVGVESFTPEYP